MKRVAINATLASVVLFAGLVSSCTTTSAGEPRPQTTAGGQESTSRPGDLPSRPRELKLDDVDPCTLISQSDYPDFHMDESGKPGTDDLGSAECLWTGTAVGYFGITLRVSEGIEVWLDGSKNTQGEVTDPILEFPSVTFTLEDDNPCFVSVDVADGQQLLVQVGIDGPSVDSVPPVCEYAHQFATSAMNTLVES